MTAALAPRVSRDFVVEVKQLLDAWKPIKDEYAQLAKRHLQFAGLIVTLWERAKSLDRGNGNSVHKDYMRKQLQQLVQTDDLSILSRWRTIGEQSESLLSVAKQLPSDRDHLYEIAKAVKQSKPVADWVADKKVHPGVSVREIRNLTQDVIRKRPNVKLARSHSVTITFSPAVEAEAVVAVLQSAFLSDSVELINTSNAVQSACESIMRNEYDSKLKTKFKSATAPGAASKRKRVVKKKSSS